MSEGVAGEGLRGSVRAIIAVGLVGMFLGLLWGVADVPRYTAVSSVVVGSGDPVFGPADQAELERLAELGGGTDVATVAAGLLGGDVAGADLLADVSIARRPAGVLLVKASADSPDFAAATANGFAQALVEVGGDRLVLGAEATLPDSPSENRSALLWSVIGLILGLVAAGAATAAVEWRRSPRLRSAPPLPPPDRKPIPEPGPTAPRRDFVPAADAFGVRLVARVGDPAKLVADVEAGIEVDGADEEVLADLAEDLRLERDGPPRTLAVLDASTGDGSEAVVLALAVAAARLGLRVIVVDANLRHPSLAEWAGVEESPGLHDYLLGQAGPRDVLRSVTAEDGRDEPVPFVCVPAGERRTDLAGGISGPRFDGLLDRLPRAYDVVLFAGPPALGDDDAQVLAGAVDAVVLVSANDDGAGSRIARSVELLAPARPAAGVLTRSHG